MATTGQAVARRPWQLLPALAVTDRLRTRARLLVLVAVLLVPTVFATGSFAAVIGGQVAFATLERSGVRVLVPAAEALTEVAEGRAPDLTELREAVSARPRLKLDAAFAQVRATGGAPNAATAAALAGLIRAVGDNSNLILDPDLDSFYLMDALVVQVPRALLALGPRPEERSGPGQAALPAELLREAVDQIRSDVRTALQHTTLPGLSEDLDVVVVSGDRLSEFAGQLALAAPSPTAVLDRQGAATVIRSASRALSTSLGALLTQRLHLLGLRRALTLAATLAGLGFAGWIAAAVIWRTRRNVHLTLAGVGAISTGDLQAQVLPNGKDEFGDIGRAVQGARQRLEHLLFKDPLTALPNRPLFLERLRQALQDADQASVSVLFLDLDRFKAVNDRFGHAAGDELLRLAAGRLRDCVRPQDTASRFGVDEFAVVLGGRDRGEEGRQHAFAVAQRIIAALREPFRICGQSVLIGATVGVAHNDPVQDTDADMLLAQADLALYDAKRDGGGQARTYDPSMHAVHLERLQLESDLQGAVPGGELDVHYQPIVDLASGGACGLEALVRWHRPGAGLVAPGIFIPVAETTGLIVDIGRWVLDSTCAQLAVWRRTHPALTANVNVSVQQLRDPRFVGDVEATLKRVRVPGSALTLEITESMLVEGQLHVVDRLHDLKQLGVRIALDDFGTGYSCLSYLQRLPLDILKIDRSFVSGMAGRANTQVVRSIIDLAHAFELGTTAEGVETAGQWSRLAELGCRTGQGFYFSRPLTVGAATSYLTAPPPVAAPDRHPDWSTPVAAGAGARWPPADDQLGWEPLPPRAGVPHQAPGS